MCKAQACHIQPPVDATSPTEQSERAVSNRPPASAECRRLARAHAWPRSPPSPAAASPRNGGDALCHRREARGHPRLRPGLKVAARKLPFEVGQSRSQGPAEQPGLRLGRQLGGARRRAAAGGKRSGVGVGWGRASGARGRRAGRALGGGKACRLARTFERSAGHNCSRQVVAAAVVLQQCPHCQLGKRRRAVGQAAAPPDSRALQNSVRLATRSATGTRGMPGSSSIRAVPAGRQRRPGVWRCRGVRQRPSTRCAVAGLMWPCACGLHA